MTVSTVVDHNDYTGNGVTTSFPYTFRIFKKTDLAVSVIDLNENITVLVLDTDYTVTNAGGYNGGNVVLTAPLANGWQISIARELEPTQETDLRNQGKFFAEVHEDAFDKLTMLIQQVASMFRLALRKPSSIANWYDALNNYIRNLRDPRDPQDAATKNYVDTLANNNYIRTLRVPEPINQLPAAADRANKMPVFDSAGNAIVVFPPSGSATDVMIELAKPTGSGLVGFDPSLTYPSGTAGYWLDEALSHTQKNIVFATADGGIPNDGSDVSTQVSTFLNANKGKFIVFDSGTYMFAGVVLSGTGWEGTTIYFKGKHLLKPDTTGTNTPGYGGFIGLIITKTVNDLTLYYRGDGNRTLQYNREHIFNVAIYGSTNLSIPYFKCDEIRGDGLYINSEDQTSSTAQNATNINIGTVLGKNTEVDGRNLISIVSCNRGSIKTFISENIGGVVGGFQQPGGLDVEPNNLPGCLVRDFVIEDAVSVGAGGVYLVADWNASPAKIQNCHVLKAIVRGGQKVRMYGANQSSMNAECTSTTGDSAAAAEGNASCTMSVRAINCTTGALIGTQSTNYDCKFTVFARSISNAGVITGGLRRSDLDLDFGEWLSGGNGIGLWFRDLNNIGSLTQESNRIKIRCPKTANVNRAIQYTPGTSPLSFIGDNILSDSVFTNWATFDVILGAAGQYLTKEGKMPFLTTSALSPTNGTWKQGDFVYYSTPSTTNKIYGFYRITTGSGNVSGLDWGTVSFT
ncbi:hypothetical protein UXP39_12695 [Enterobacter sichuanensis]|uniref:hypothetical protein n=1 Tax=Enterobacter sichuanensis TaxID=2071710 RepID=UPI002FCFE7DB